MLEDYLRFYRTVIVRKVEGLPRELAVRPAAPSILSALGIVKHLAWVERGWSRRAVLGEEYPVPWTDEDPDADLRIEDDETVDDVLDFYRAECAAADAIWATRSLDDSFPGGSHGPAQPPLDPRAHDRGDRAPRRPPRPHRRSSSTAAPATSRSRA